MKTLLAVLILFMLCEVTHGQYFLQRVTNKDSTLKLPVAMEVPGDGTDRIFIGQLQGKILVFRNSESFDTGKVFLDISDKVFKSTTELGLLGFAFHPHFKENGFIYVNYIAIVDNLVQTVISRFHVSSTNHDTALSSSELILLKVVQPGWAHKGGRIAFGKDGFLYIPFGDGGNGGDPDNFAQNLTSLLGKILRIDVDIDAQGFPPYAIPSDNPFVDDTTGIRKEIYAYGFRNPFKSYFDSLTGRLWVGDDGQERFEEIDTVVKGGNYGWRMMEGFHRYADSTADTGKLILPLWEYDHWDPKGGFAVIGGFIYHGKLYPKLKNKYIYADYATARIWALSVDSGLVTNQMLVDHDNSGINISSLGEDKDGNIYVVSISNGRIYKLISTAGVEVTNVQKDFPLSADRTLLDELHPNTEIHFTVEKSGHTSISLLNIAGQEIRKDVDREMNAGKYSYKLDARTLENGMYFVRLTSASQIVTQKIIVVR